MGRRFEGRAVLVTGGSSGIGRAAVLLLAREGARVVVAARGEQRGEAVVREVEEEGGEALFVATDVADPAAVEAAVSRTVAAYGRLDGALNNAASYEGIFRPTAEFGEEEVDRALAVSLAGTWRSLKHEIRQMLAQSPPGGAIVNTSSVNGLGGAATASIYSAAKAGVLALTKSAAQEYAQQGIRINALVPGAFRTPMLEHAMESYAAGGGREAREQVEARYLSLIPLGRIGRPEEAAEAALWLLSDAASYVTGCSLIVDGGMTAPVR